MPILLAAIHGILTRQTDPSWPDKLDVWMLKRDPQIKVLKKEYVAGPFPRWNCWVKDPRLAQALANEIELFLTVGAHDSDRAMLGTKAENRHDQSRALPGEEGEGFQRSAIPTLPQSAP